MLKKNNGLEEDGAIFSTSKRDSITFFIKNDAEGSILFVSSNFSKYFKLPPRFFMENVVSFTSLVREEERISFKIKLDKEGQIDFGLLNHQNLAIEKAISPSDKFYCRVDRLQNEANETVNYEINLFPTEMVKEMELRTDDSINLENQISIFANNSFEAIIISENDYCIGVNSAAAKMFGVKENEFIGKHASNIIHSSSQELVFNNIKNNVLHPYDIQVIRGDGSTLHVETQGKKATIGNRVIRISSIRDISDRKATEALLNSEKESLKQANERLKSKTLFLEAVNELTQNLGEIHSVDELFWYLIELLQSKFGFMDCVIYELEQKSNNLIEKKRNVIGDKQDTRPFIIRNFEGIVGACAKSRTPILINDLSKDERYVSDGFVGLSELSAPIIIDNEVFGVIDSEHKDKNYFTEEHKEILLTIAVLAGARIKNIQSALRIRESEVKHRLIFEKAYDAIVLVKNGVLVSCNPVAVEMFGCDSKEDIIGHSPLEFYPNYQLNGELSELLMIKKVEDLNTVSHNSYSWLHCRKDGTIFHTEVSLNRFDFDGEEYIQAMVRDVSSRVELTESIKKSKELYRKLLEVTSSVAWEYDLRNSKFNYMSSQIERITGYKKAEWLDYDFWLSIIHPEDRSRAQAYCEKNIALRQNHNHEYRIIRKDGEICWFHDVVTVILENDEPAIIRGCFLDITEEKQAEFVKRKFTEELHEKVEELQIAKRKFETLFDESRVALMEQDFTEFISSVRRELPVGTSIEEMVVLDPDWFKNQLRKIKIKMVNQASVRLFEARDKEELTERLEEIITSAAVIGFAEITKSFFKGDMDTTVQTELKGLKGAQIIVVVKFFFKRDKKNNSLIANVSMVDVTERVKYSEELSYQNKSLEVLSKQLSVNNERLLHSEANLEVLFQENPVSIIEFDVGAILNELEKKKLPKKSLVSYLENNPSYLSVCLSKLKILRANKRLFKLLGLPNINSIYQQLLPIDNKQFIAVFKQFIAAFYMGNHRFSDNIQLVHSSGKKIYTLIKVVLMEDTGKALVSLINITDLKRIENELRISKRKAEEGDQLKTEFLNNLSHEIRTPLNGIIGFSNIITEEDLSKEVSQKYAKIIKNSGNQLIRIIDEIIEISKLQTNQAHLREVQLCVNELTNELFAIFKLECKDKNLKIHMEQGLSDRDSTIMVDETKLQKILSNLLQNAFKFTRNGEINFGYALVDNYLEFYVTDTGIGIAPDKMDRIFEKFAQADSLISADYGGLGLGLFIVKEHVDLLKGEISVESIPNEGSRFKVRIPYKPIYRGTSGTEKLLTGQDLEITEESAILVVEDDEVNAIYLKALLKKLGVTCRLMHAKNGEEAVAACFPGSGIILVLMDIGMPKMDGYQATKIIKSTLPHLPIIAQTAYSTSEDQEKIAMVGMDDFIAKPIDRNKLESVLSKYITMRPLKLI